MKMKIWSAQKMESPAVGGIIPRPLAWLTDKYGADVDPRNEVRTGEIVEIGAHTGDGYCVRVMCEVPSALICAVWESQA